jgi:RNA polymerase sigma factor (sigma-70 family)
MARRSLSLVLRHLRTAVGRQPGAGTTDADLVERFVVQRDEAAFELLVWRYEGLVRGVCRRVLRSEEEVEDACQATFLTLACRAATIGRRQCLSGWLHQVAFRIALRARAGLARRRRHEQAAGEHRLRQGQSGSAREESCGDLRSVVDEEVGRLPEKYRVPIVLCYFEGKTNEDAALQLGCPTGTVVTWLARARRQLRARLARRGVGVGDGALAALLTWSDAPRQTPPAFVPATVKAALRFAEDRAAAGLVATRVALLARGTLHAMLLKRLQTAGTILLALCLAGAGSAVLAYGRWAPETPPRTPNRELVLGPQAARPEPAAAPELPVQAAEPPAARAGEEEEVIPAREDRPKVPKVLVQRPLKNSAPWWRNWRDFCPFSSRKGSSVSSSLE